jgi:hypothetical protein
LLLSAMAEDERRRLGERVTCLGDIAAGKEVWR